MLRILGNWRLAYIICGNIAIESSAEGSVFSCELWNRGGSVNTKETTVCCILVC